MTCFVCSMGNQARFEPSTLLLKGTKNIPVSSTLYLQALPIANNAKQRSLLYKMLKNAISYLIRIDGGYEKVPTNGTEEKLQVQQKTDEKEEVTENYIFNFFLTVPAFQALKIFSTGNQNHEY